MPCYDHRDAEDKERLQKNYAFLEAALCGTLKALEVAHAGYRGDSLDVIDYKEAGILKEDLIRWQKEHNEQDAEDRDDDSD